MNGYQNTDKNSGKVAVVDTYQCETGIHVISKYLLQTY